MCSSAVGAWIKPRQAIVNYLLERFVFLDCQTGGLSSSGGFILYGR